MNIEPLLTLGLRSRAIVSILSVVTCASCATSAPPIYVDIGEPRHWTLDDAHYLLAGSHDRARSPACRDRSVLLLVPRPIQIYEPTRGQQSLF